MFSIPRQPLIRFWPDIDIVRFLSQKPVRRAIPLDLEEMPENLQRDIGIFDGRARRGERPEEEGAFRAARLIYSQRPL
ncbi:hypothetical protein ACRQ1B_03490 [Rhizobium panacihumi]|uniref:hypothetical protein n=1 Tax=Rhizobium panacihumi TaxID=2008450 RepID=UPI003D7AA0D0